MRKVDKTLQILSLEMMPLATECLVRELVKSLMEHCDSMEQGLIGVPEFNHRDLIQYVADQLNERLCNSSLIDAVVDRFKTNCHVQIIDLSEKKGKS